MDMAGYHRKSTLIDTKFTEYLWSIIFAAMAMSANVIVDGIIVGNLLGADALAAVNIAGPVPMLVSVLSIVIGLGGATSIAIQKGRREPALADRIYTVCLTVAAFLMVAFFLAGQLFFTATPPAGWRKAGSHSCKTGIPAIHGGLGCAMKERQDSRYSRRSRPQGGAQGCAP